ncbi:uncharacterized protein J4E88_001725 [Alternaria novae-zelandiae]|uniref:uncharacterized protein n=1 Tax=Alternaria novae-zelandiae TaxID=430562 RepID=UPI0020C1CDD0|nr:uncharacterized protein J4E88_001725 [Alternaria novae-zelandiae]KAI4693354.1 hypothetical protein J4E88_001725 [Alternaria novae-zelandiae]
MTTHHDSTPMEIDVNSIGLASPAGTDLSPNSPGKSDSGRSDSSNLSYTDDFETLPSSGPTSHAHILDLGEYAASMKEEGALKLQDAVVTALYSISPATLKLFVSPTVNTFKAVFGKKDVQLVVWRKGLEVFIGTFENHTSMKAYRFEHVAGFLIGYDGSWHLKVTASNAYSAPKWPDVWAGKFECHGGVAKMTIETGETEMAKRASALAAAMIDGRYWELKTDVKLT